MANPDLLSPPPHEIPEEHQRRVISKITWRLMPLLFVCYIVAYLDRINVGFAKDALVAEMGIDPSVAGAVFGTGAGLFFIGYFLFEVPSNLILQKLGARLWIARIMIVWGFVSMAFVFVDSKATFYTLRFLLGAAEAGFFPGVLLYLTYWIPARERSKAVALFALGGIAAGVIGTPLSIRLLQLHGLLGMEGWRWMFLLEALPALMLGVYVLLRLPNGPQHVSWLTDQEKTWLQQKLASDAEATAGSNSRLIAAFRDPRVWLLCAIYFLVNVGGYGYEFWGPSLIAEITGDKESMLNMLPYLLAGVAMVLVGRNSDRTGERRWHVALSATISAVAFATAALVNNPWIAIAALMIAFAGQKSTLGPFWAMGTTALRGTAAAGGIAFINSVGNLGGFFGPQLAGKLYDATGSRTATLLSLGGALLLLGVIALFIRDTSRNAER